jgi:hypothetical protein
MLPWYAADDLARFIAKKNKRRVAGGRGRFGLD